MTALGLALALPFTRTQGVGWSPSQLGSSLLAWWTADRADLLTLSGAQVTSWRDTVAGYDLVQAVGGARPVYSATSFNGFPGITSDGIDDELTMESQPLPSGSSPSGMLAVASQDALADDTTVRAIFAYGGSNSTSQQRILRRNVFSGVNRGVLAVGDGSSLSSRSEDTVDFTGRHTIQGSVGATSSLLEVDAIEASPLAVVPGTGTVRVRAFANANTAISMFWKGTARDLVVWDEATITTDQRTKLAAWAAARRAA